MQFSLKLKPRSTLGAKVFSRATVELVINGRLSDDYLDSPWDKIYNAKQQYLQLFSD